MRYEVSIIRESDIPSAVWPANQHALETYASETNKVYSIWMQFSTSHADYRPHPCSSSVYDIMKHQLLSERRFFAEFLGLPEPAA